MQTFSEVEKLQIPFTFLKGYYHATKTILNVIRCVGEARWHISPIMDRYESNEIKPSIAWEYPFISGIKRMEESLKTCSNLW